MMEKTRKALESKALERKALEDEKRKEAIPKDDEVSIPEPTNESSNEEARDAVPGEADSFENRLNRLKFER